MLYAIFNFLTTGPGTDCVLAIPALAVAAIIGALMGAAKGIGKEGQATTQRKYEAETAKWSPWTGLQSHFVQNPNMLDEMSKGAATGMSFGAANQGMFGGGGTSAASAGVGDSPSLGVDTNLGSYDAPPQYSQSQMGQGFNPAAKGSAGSSFGWLAKR